jgi:hypothetical protein
MSPELALISRRQRGVFRRSQALACGYSDVDLDRLVRAGSWNKVRHGIYTAEAYDEAGARTDRRMHLLAAAARALALQGDMVLSHASAAVWHEVQLLDAWPAEPTLTLAASQSGHRLTSHGFPILPIPPTHRLGAVTTAARTVVDCARTYGRAAGLVTAESALRLGLDRLALDSVLTDCAGWPGIVVARDVCAFADEFSETALESLVRLWCRDQGLPAPAQQRTVRALDGRFVAEVDFVWEDLRTVLEADGRKKYVATDGDPAKPDPVLWAEKLREDDLRDCGLEVVRGYWQDGADGGAALAERLRRAFARGQRRTDEPEYAVGPPTRRPARPLAA